MNASPIDLWVQSYLTAWASDDPEDIGALFTEDARYCTEPYAKPWEGREEIVREWIARGDSGREWSFTSETLVVAGDLAIVQGRTHYGKVAEPEPEPARDYENLWVVRLTPDGCAREFTEWWMERDSSQTSAPGAERDAS